MIIGREFVSLVTMPEKDFLKIMAGKGSQAAINNYNAFDRAIAQYARRNHRMDFIQIEALRRAQIHRNFLLGVFRHYECQAQKAINDDGEKVDVCHKHGTKQNCKAAFEKAIKPHTY